MSIVNPLHDLTARGCLTQPPAPPPSARIRHVALRWLSILALAVIAAVTFHLVLPVAWKHALSVDVPYSPPFTATATLLLTFLSFCAIVEPIRIRPHQWSTIPYYPPLWVAVLLGCLMAAGAECLPPDLRPQMGRPSMAATVGTPAHHWVVRGCCLCTAPFSATPFTFTCNPKPDRQCHSNCGSI